MVNKIGSELEKHVVTDRTLQYESSISESNTMVSGKHEFAVFFVNPLLSFYWFSFLTSSTEYRPLTL